MAVDVTLNNISSGYNLTKLNENFTNIETALQSALGLSGNVPNSMNADLDMDSQNILNANTIDAAGITLGGISLLASLTTVVPRGNWTVSTDYVVGDLVESEGISYIAHTAHTSDGSSFATDRNTYWTIFAAAQAVVQAPQEFSGDGADVTFGLATEPSNEKEVLIWVDGVYQQHSTFSVSGTTLTFSEAPPIGTNNIEVWYMVGTTTLTGDGDVSGPAVSTDGSLALYDGTTGKLLKDGAVIGTDVQAEDATLTSIAALGTAADKLAYTTGIDTWAEATVTSAGLAILDDANAAAQLITLGIDGSSGVIAPGDISQGVLAAKNLVINGGFQTNQRVYVSTTATADGVYMHDRWRSGSADSSYTFSVAAPSSPQTVTIAANDSIEQVIEGANIGTAGTHTISWTGTATARAVVNTQTMSGNFAVSPITVTAVLDQIITMQFTGADAAGGSTEATNTGTLGKVQCELGSVATAFEHRDYSLELSRCQRYFFKTFAQTTAPAQSAGFVGAFSFVATSNGSLMLAGDYPVEMQTNPTLVFYNPAAANNDARNNSDNTDTNVAASGAASASRCILNLTPDATDANDDMHIHITADAEL